MSPATRPWSGIRYSNRRDFASSKVEGLESHAFWSLDRSLLELPEGVLARIQGYRQITDAVLLAAAMQRGGVLATFDSGIASLVANRERRFVCVIPV